MTTTSLRSTDTERVANIILRKEAALEKSNSLDDRAVDMIAGLKTDLMDAAVNVDQARMIKETISD